VLILHTRTTKYRQVAIDGGRKISVPVLEFLEYVLLH
jgi:hypothetical protein